MRANQGFVHAQDQGVLRLRFELGLSNGRSPEHVDPVRDSNSYLRKQRRQGLLAVAGRLGRANVDKHFRRPAPIERSANEPIRLRRSTQQ